MKFWRRKEKPAPRLDRLDAELARYQDRGELTRDNVELATVAEVARREAEAERRP